MNSDLKVALSNECGPSRCSQFGMSALLQSRAPKKSSCARAHAPRPDAHIYSVAQGYQPESSSAHGSLAGANRWQRRAACARKNLRSRRRNGLSIQPRMLLALLAHDGFIGYLRGITECIEPRATCGTETSLELFRSDKPRPTQAWRGPQPRLHMLANCWQAHLILPSSPPRSRTTIFAHHWLASTRLQPSSLREPIASDLAAHRIIRTNA